MDNAFFVILSGFQSRVIYARSVYGPISSTNRIVAVKSELRVLVKRDIVLSPSAVDLTCVWQRTC